MNILFWNLKGNKNEKWIAEIIREKDVDIAVFAEYTTTVFEDVISNLENQYIQHDGNDGCDKISLLCKTNIQTIVRREQARYTLYSCVANGNLYNIIGVHLPASPNSDENDRKEVIRDIVDDICEQENELKCRETIVIGDFNCNPFDNEIIQKDSFNAVLYKSLIHQQETVIYHNKRKRRFYNPILHFISESTQTYGSFYYSSGIAPLYWNSFDQVLVRKELVDKICSLEYIKSVNNKNLLKEVKPNSMISDHLPLLVNIMEGE